MKRLAAFALGAVLGFVTGLTIAWQAPSADPSQVSGDPSTLTTESKEAYILLVSMSYMQDGDFERAKQRLALLNDFELRNTLAALSDRYTTELRPEIQRRALAKMAVAMGSDSAALRVYIVTPTPTPTPLPTLTATASSTPLPPTPTPTASLTPTPSITPTPNPSPTQTPVVAFRVFDFSRVPCDQSKSARAQLQIYVQDIDGQGIPGVRVRVQWNDGQDEFFTGLKSVDPGYAEYDLQPARTYSALVADSSSEVAFGLDSAQLDPGCPNDGQPHFRAWRVVFRRNN